MFEFSNQPSEQEYRIKTIIELLKHKDPGYIQTAIQLANILNLTNVSAKQLAKRMAISRSHLTNILRLLSLPTSIQELITAGNIPHSTARALIPIADEQIQLRIAKEIIHYDWSTRKTERYVKEILIAGSDPLTQLPVTNATRQKRSNAQERKA